MEKYRGSCPLTQRRLIEEYFMEHRNQVLEIAAFLDRLDRSPEDDAKDDFRLRALREAIGVLGAGRPEKVMEVQMLLSDTDTALLEELDRKAAYGASVRGGE